MEDFEQLKKTELDIKLQPAATKLYQYVSEELLPLLGKSILNVRDSRSMYFTVLFYLPQAQVSVLRNKTSKKHGLLKTGIEADTLHCFGAD